MLPNFIISFEDPIFSNLQPSSIFRGFPRTTQHESAKNPAPSDFTNRTKLPVGQYLQLNRRSTAMRGQLSFRPAPAAAASASTDRCEAPTDLSLRRNLCAFGISHSRLTPLIKAFSAQASIYRAPSVEMTRRDAYPRSSGPRAADVDAGGYGLIGDGMDGLQLSLGRSVINARCCILDGSAVDF